uniref:Uncharacterized protein n=1 Tax=Anoplophora glabripennis TaxID=217634 RepID=V5G7E6_ANOGL
MQEIISDLEQLKISAFSKVKKINQCINEVPIGPNSRRNTERTKQDQPVKTKKCADNNKFQCTSENGLPIRHILKELEIQRQGKFTALSKTRLNKFEEFSRQQEVTKKQQWLKQQQAFIEDMQQKESRIFEALNEYDKITSNEHARLTQHYQEIAERRKNP